VSELQSVTESFSAQERPEDAPHQRAVEPPLEQLGRTSPQRATAVRRPELDGIRALAVSAAFFSHLTYTYSAGGWIGVDVFFVLSGYLITRNLLAEHERTGRIRLRQFYARRALRLLPALVLMYVLGAFFYRTLGEHGSRRGYTHTVAWGLGYAENITLGLWNEPHGNLGHTWSLAMEEQFYLLWPPLLYLLFKFKRSAVPFLFVGLILSWVSLTFTTDHTQYVPLTYYRPDTRIGDLIVGCLLAYGLRAYGARIARWRVFMFAVGFMSLAGLVADEIFASAKGRSGYLQLEIPAAALFSAGLVMCLVVSDRKAIWVKVFGWRPLAAIGAISYGIYLFMIPVLYVLPQHWTHYAGNYYYFGLQMYIATIIIAAASYRLVERPFLRLKGRFSSPAQTVARDVVTPAVVTT